MSDFDESAEIKAVQRDANSLIKRLQPLAKLKSADPKVIDALTRALATLPSSSEVGAAVDELRGRSEKIVRQAGSQRAALTRTIEAEFIRKRRESGDAVREAGEAAWRVGSIEIQFDREQARARVLYNREQLLPWAATRHLEDVEELANKAQQKLRSATIPDESLADVFSGAYEYLASKARNQMSGSYRAPLPEFYREVRVALARHELSNGKAERKLESADFPLWAFLYNLDRYRALADLPAERRLNFETGSQSDHQKRMAMTVNGLDAASDYKSYCYVYAVPSTPR